MSLHSLATYRPPCPVGLIVLALGQQILTSLNDASSSRLVPLLGRKSLGRRGN